MLKIAIVDDDNACLEQEAAYTARYAKEKQLQIETSIFHSGMELMKQLSNRFDIIFLDIEMDGMDGMETAREIRKAGSDAVIVFITKLFYNKEVYGLNIPQNAGNIGTAVIWRNASLTDNYGAMIGDYNNQINTELKLLNGEVWLIRTNADETKTEKLIAKL